MPIIERSVYVEGREWFDRTNGNTYFSARIWVDGKWVATMPMQYGYGDQYLYEAVEVLREAGYHNEKATALWVVCEHLNVDLYKSMNTVLKRDLFKADK